MIIELLFFTIISCSIFILISNHPIYCLFSLILTFINFSILLINLGLEFLALSYIIVYVGAICVLFIFVILLLNIRVYSLTSRENFLYMATTIIVTLIVVLVYMKIDPKVIDLLRLPDELLGHKGDLALFGRYFFNYNWQYLLLSILLLLLAVIATIAVSLKRTKNHQLDFSFFELK